MRGDIKLSRRTDKQNWLAHHLVTHHNLSCTFICCDNDCDFRSSLREGQPTPILAAVLLVQPKDASRSSSDEKIVSTRFYLEFVKLFCIRCRSSARHNVKMGTTQLKRYIILQVEFWTSRCYVVIDWIKSLF